MVHALHEMHRVLKPDGVLVDLRPAAVHRRVGVQVSTGYQALGVMREKFDDDRAANRAVAEVLRRGLFRPGGRWQVGCNRVFDGLDEFRDWLADFVQTGKLPSHDWLLRRVERACARSGGRPRIVVSGPLVLRVLRRRQPVRRAAA